MADAASRTPAAPGALSTELHVNVVTPRGTVSTVTTDAITAPGELGEFEVLPGHVPFLTALHPGVLTIGERSKEVFAVTRGYLRVGQDGAIEVLVEQASPRSEIDVTRAKEDLVAAQKILDTLKDAPLDADWKVAKAHHDWAQARLDAAAN